MRSRWDCSRQCCWCSAGSARDHELTAARASGISLITLIWPVLLLSLLCCGLSAWINMQLGPQCRVVGLKLLERVRDDLLLNAQLPEGQYIRDVDPSYIFYTRKNHNGDLQGVMVFKLENGSNATTTVYAPRGRMDVDKPNKQLILHLYDARSITTGDNVAISSSPDSIINIPIFTIPDKYRRTSISDMTFWQLRDELADLESKLGLPATVATNSAEQRMQLALAAQERKDFTEPIRVEMNRQIAFSFACFGFTLVGIPLGIRVHRRETNVGVAIALGLVLIYYAFVLTAKSLAARPEFVPHLIVWLPNFIFQAVGAVLLWRANKGI
ncbi:MAG: LptF/LptG family permease [Limisphaerales bacterium]